MASETDEIPTPQLPFPQLPGHSTFRSMSVNAVALVPLLCQGEEESHSYTSFLQLLKGLQRYSKTRSENNQYPFPPPEDVNPYEDDNSMTDVDIHSVAVTPNDDPRHGHVDYTPTCLLVVPNAQLTRPGDWRYERSPLRNFHWSQGCKRINFFDGRPSHSREAHDRLLLQSTREWIDLIPSRRTAAVIGILNLRDCHNKTADLQRAVQELSQWSERYSTPAYESTAHGRSFTRDAVVQRLFVFDSFEDSIQGVDLASTKLGSNLVAFPPSENLHMMDLHLNVVVNDLVVAIFRQLEIKIRENDALCKEKGLSRPTPKMGAGDRPQPSNLSLNNIASVVSSDNRLSLVASPRTGAQTKSAFSTLTANAMSAIGHPRGANRGPQLLTPLDLDMPDADQALSARDAEALKKRELGRREKLSADLSLLAGSPLDAYERYSRAAELCRASPDPLWYASALEGCAAAHICMAEAGGYNVDLYLETNFALPDDFMACAHTTTAQQEKKNLTKQGLPAVIYALADEALNILNRHPKLAYYHAELLLKLCHYGQGPEETHLRCKWGFGEGCFGGDPGEPRRWDTTSAARLAFGPLVNKDGEDLIALNSIQRLQRWTECLHRAASVGGLDPLTRAELAIQCADMCMQGLQTTKWKHHEGFRWCLPRKAAFFMATAADSLSKLEFVPSTELWLAASRLYSNESNATKDGYGWAALRASMLFALSQQEDACSGEVAAKLLLTLLSEMSPETIGANAVAVAKKAETVDDAQSVRSISSRYTNYTRYSRSERHVNTRGSFLSNVSQPGLLTVIQAKWADDAPLSSAPMPLAEEDTIALNAVLPNIMPVACARAQKLTMRNLIDLRHEMPGSSLQAESGQEEIQIHEGTTAAPPLRIVSAAIVVSESHLLLERAKAAGYSGKNASGAMSTFFNPFDKKKQEAKKIAATLVAEGEEREVLIEFSNRLSVPLEVPSCELVFDKANGDQIKSPALSFTVPAKATNFTVHFPFIVIAQPHVTEQANEDVAIVGSSLFEVVGIRVTALSRSVVIPISETNDGTERVNSRGLLPDSMSIYQLSKHNKPTPKQIEIKPRLETVPAQPNLYVSFTTLQTPIEDGTTVPVHLSDGEIFTIPSFRLENDFGPSGLGTMERLQIMAVGLPGLPDEVLFDTDALAAAREEEEETDDSDADEEDFEELMAEDGLPPLKMKASCENLSLQSINDKSKSHREGSIVTFQIAATHDLGQQLADGGHVRIRFRYRGISPSPATEIWRKREVALRIVRVKGPRISSLTFRSDLGWGSAYSELCMSLAEQKNQFEAVAKRWESFRSPLSEPEGNTPEEKVKDESKEKPLLTRVGMDQGVHVSSDEVVVLMAVANETNSTIVLSNRKGRVGGFEGSPMPTVRVTSGVSVKIPVVIPRIPRLSDEEEDGVTDIASELVASTALQWVSVLDSKGDDTSQNRKIRQGRVRIPSRCLKEIMSEHPAFASRICEAPVNVSVSIGRAPDSKFLVVQKGTPVDTFVEVSTAEWVPKDVVDNSSVVLEFCCARKNCTEPQSKKSFMWFGRLRRKLALGEKEKKHRARIAFVEDGLFVISACAKITQMVEGSGEETWWAPIAETVLVENPNVST